PEIAGLQAELKAADIDQTAAKNRYAPRVNLELSDSNALHSGGAPGSQRDQRVMLVFNWSLFNGGGDLKIGQEKAARYSELRYKLDDQRRRLLQSLSAQYATLEATRERIATGYRELESIATAARAMSNRMISGNQSLLDMLDVYDRFYQARTHLVVLHVQEMGAVAQISRLVLGTPASDLKVSMNNDFTNGLAK
ncbi:MAG: TolC family protein, partial [Betaproteobacteria bacterium]